MYTSVSVCLVLAIVLTLVSSDCDKKCTVTVKKGKTFIRPQS